MGSIEDQDRQSSNFFYHLTSGLFNIAFMILFRRICRNVDRVPKEGPALIVANHQSNLDPPLIAGPIRHRRLEYMAKEELFQSSWFGRIIGGFGAVPVKGDGDANTAVIRVMLRRLEQGRVVLVFPEGSRTQDGAMQPFKRGVALLVKRSRCPVVPVGIEGSFDSWPRSRSRPFLWGKRMGVSFGHPIPHDDLMARGPEAALDRLADEIDALRLELRQDLRKKTRGRLPMPGPGDAPRSEQTTQTSGADEQHD